MKYQRSIFRFRQDLRLDDNHGLIKAIQESKDILPIFIVDTEILARGPKNDTRLAFLSDSVRQLQNDLKKLGSDLLVLEGRPVELIPELIKQYNIQAIYTNKSYGYSSKNRDVKINEHCTSLGISFYQCKDFLLVEPDEVPQRKVFTPYSKWRYEHLDKHMPIPYQAPAHISTISVPNNNSEAIIKKIHAGITCTWEVTHSSQLLQTIKLAQYDEHRNIPSLHGTSKLSPYIRFGLISIRQLYLKTKSLSRSYTNELARREFWQHIAYHFPETRVHEFQEKRRHIKRSQDETLFTKRCAGETGYPIVDAGMKQLQQENRMHGRLRMIVASFLTKDMLVDRRLGEQWFAKYLLDYDTNVNVGNWQRSASVGADPKPLRIFNPILQSQKFDSHAHYILKYLPELDGQPLEAIHDPLTHKLDYHKPVVDHYVNSKLAKQMYYE